MIFRDKQIKSKSGLICLCLLALSFLIIPQITLANPIEGFFHLIVFGFFGWIVGLAGSLLNISINTFVSGFGDLYINRGLGFVVDQLWAIVRDIFNLTFIFGLVFIGLKMIFDSSDSNAKKVLVSLVMAALLVNFSLFFTKTIVDFSNLAGHQIVKNAFPPSPNVGSDVSGHFINITGMNSSFGAKAEQGMGFTYIFFSLILFIIMAFVFLAGAILLLIRFAVLNIYMILSPLMFLGWVFPGASGITSEYWKGFMKQAFFAPAYLLMVYFSYRVLAGFSTTAGGSGVDKAGFSDLFKAGADPTGPATETLFAVFGLTAIFLIASIVVAQKMGAIGGDAAVGGMKWMQKKGLSLAKGTAAAAVYAPKKATGYVAQIASRGVGNSLSRNLQRLQQVQGTGLGARATRYLSRTNAVNVAVGGAAKSMQQAKFGLSRTIEEDRKARNQTDAAAERAMELRQNAMPALHPVTATPAQITARQEARRRQQTQVRNMTNDELMEMARNNQPAVLDAEFASLLSDAQVQALQQRGILDNAASDQLDQNRDDGAINEVNAVLNHHNASTDNLTAAMDELNRLISTASNDRLQNMIRINAAGGVDGPLVNENIASRLSNDQVTMLRQSGRANSAQMQQITNARQGGLARIITAGSLANAGSPGGSDAGFQERQRRSMFRNAQEAGRLPIGVLSLPGSAEFLNPRIIEEFLNNNPSNADIIALRDNVRNYRASGMATPSWINQWTNWSRRTPAGIRFGL